MYVYHSFLNAILFLVYAWKDCKLAAFAEIVCLQFSNCLRDIFAKVTLRIHNLSQIWGKLYFEILSIYPHYPVFEYFWWIYFFWFQWLDISTNKYKNYVEYMTIVTNLQRNWSIDRPLLMQQGITHKLNNNKTFCL